MIVALLRYLLVLDRGDGGAPEDVFTSDRILLVAGATWVVVYGVAVYAA
jgi:decaprenyl-phosphate phosphoribosyltransferase